MTKALLDKDFTSDFPVLIAGVSPINVKIY
jgi:hypothetical protein